MDSLIFIAIVLVVAGVILYKKNPKVRDYVNSKLPQDNDEPVKAPTSDYKPYVATPVPTEVRTGLPELPIQPRPPIQPTPTPAPVPTPAPIPVPTPTPTPTPTPPVGGSDPFDTYPTAFPASVGLGSGTYNITQAATTQIDFSKLNTLDVQGLVNPGTPFDGTISVELYDDKGLEIFRRSYNTNSNFAVQFQNLSRIVGGRADPNKQPVRPVNHRLWVKTSVPGKKVVVTIFGQ